jgi:hypothetical protein
MVGAIASNNPSMREPTRLPRKLNRVLIGVGTARGKKYSPVVEASLLEQGLREFGAGLGAPRRK